ncbi:MAG: polyphosphate polymerase domain-containing protein [Acidobacteria bacterium]|nr:polyphosphate polymerase domain-containing protein [Acidobacteriota bacterium]
MSGIYTAADLPEVLGRYELMYIASQAEFHHLEERLREVMDIDRHARDGGYRVNSLYYDTRDFAAYFEKLDGNDLRTKVRLRLSGEQAARLAGRPILAPLEEGDDPGETREPLSYLQRVTMNCNLEPKCIISYYRQPFTCPINPRLRVNCDSDVRVLGPGDIYRSPVEEGVRILPESLCVVEVKFAWAIPTWILEIIRDCNLQIRRFSKYCSGVEAVYPAIAHRGLRLQEVLV